MKKIKFLALMSAIALTSAVGFTACSSSDEVTAEPNPTFDGESVKTQFTISLPFGNNATTRQTDNVVQEGANTDLSLFRGMDFIRLIPFGINRPVTSTDTRIGGQIDLVTQIKPGASDATNSINVANLLSNSNSVLYQDVQIPVGTGAFLFYGKAIDNVQNTPIGTISDKFKFGTLTSNGLLTPANNTAPTDITFTPVQIMEDGATAATGSADKIAEYMTNIAKAAGWSTDTNPAMQQLYTRFISMKAGSSQAVADLVGDLLWSIRNNTTTVADAIRDEIYHHHTPDATTGDISCTDGYIAKATLTTNTYQITLGSSCAGYPANKNLPEGAAQISWDGTNSKFEVTSTDIPTATSTKMNVAALQNYVYPANLQYYVNSRALVSEQSQADKYDGTNNWSTITGFYNAGYVSVPTRSVAIEKPIQYGVAQLKIQAKAKTTTLEDNSDKLETAPTASVTVPTGGITIKGILIGGQRAVDWEFLPNTSGSLYTIYDNAIPSGVVVGQSDYAGFNYTLALETPVQEKVYIALELVNNTGVTFYGQNNEKILPDRTFYLVGEIDPTNPKTAANHVRDHKAYWSNGTPATKVTGDAIDQVFVQDYVTTLNLSIKDLRNALNTIPDLRMPNMEFGLSVDLKWETGLSFDIEL